MRNPFKFFIELMNQPVWVPIWVFYLMLVNVASAGFWDMLLAQVIFVTFILSATLMMGLYSWFGFEKILGIGHVLWIPLFIYVFMEIPNTKGIFQSYLIVLSISISVSLVFDTIDVLKYFASQKKLSH